MWEREVVRAVEPQLVKLWRGVCMLSSPRDGFVIDVIDRFSALVQPLKVPSKSAKVSQIRVVSQRRRQPFSKPQWDAENYRVSERNRPVQNFSWIGKIREELKIKDVVALVLYVPSHLVPRLPTTSIITTCVNELAHPNEKTPVAISVAPKDYPTSQQIQFAKPVL